MVLTAVQVASEEAFPKEVAIIIQSIRSRTGGATTVPTEWQSTNASNSSAKTVEPTL